MGIYRSMDGELPDYSHIGKYFGNAGIQINTFGDGWDIIGFAPEAVTAAAQGVRHGQGLYAPPAEDHPARLLEADVIQRQRLAELVTDLYLATGTKREAIWKRAVTAMQKLGVPAGRASTTS